MVRPQGEKCYSLDTRQTELVTPNPSSNGMTCR